MKQRRNFNQTSRTGWGSGDAAERLTRHGPNVLGKTKQRSVFVIPASPVPQSHRGATRHRRGVALALGEIIEAVVILVVTLSSTPLSASSRNGKRQKRLRGSKQAVSVARVLRDGKERQLPAGRLASQLAKVL